VKHHFLWLDLETTGLFANTKRILEWSAVLAHDGIDGDMSPVFAFHGVINQRGEEWLAEMDPFVTGMHTRNGLIAECQSGRGFELEAAEDLLLEIASRVSVEPRSVVLAGSTVAFDQGFLRAHMPRLAVQLSHRCFDVSTLKMADRAWADQPFKKAEAHRALPDVLESLEHAKEIRRRRWPKP
jgi:oligoribonuclease (3'-5' exoribonuclease)